MLPLTVVPYQTEKISRLPSKIDVQIVVDRALIQGNVVIMTSTRDGHGIRHNIAESQKIVLAADAEIDR